MDAFDFRHVQVEHDTGQWGDSTQDVSTNARNSRNIIGYFHFHFPQLLFSVVMQLQLFLQQAA